MWGPTKTAQLQLYSSVLGGNSISAWSTLRADSHKGRSCTHRNVQSHQGHDTTGMNRESRAARLECSFKGEIWSSFSLPKYVAGTTLQFSDVFRKVCSNATILSVLASQPRGKLWIKRREGLNWGGSTQEEDGKRRTPKDCDRSFKRPQRSQEQEQPCLPYQFLQRCWAEFPTEPCIQN